MALIKFGMMMTDARGKLGGQVFTKTRSGATVRTKVTPTNPQTTAQQTSRNILGSLSASWRNLSESDRQGWLSSVDLFSKTNIFGDSYKPSGKNLYVGLNANLLSIGATPSDSAPDLADVPVYILESIGIEVGLGIIDLNASTAYPGAGFTVVFQATKPMSAGRYNFSGQFATFYTYSSTLAPTPSTVYGAYVSKFGAPQEGNKVAIRAFVIVNASGQKGVPTQAETIVLA